MTGKENPGARSGAHRIQVNVQSSSNNMVKHAEQGSKRSLTKDEEEFLAHLNREVNRMFIAAEDLWPNPKPRQRKPSKPRPRPKNPDQLCFDFGLPQVTQ